ncbi:MAG: sigma-70 family RNA polymerase sigma factor [Proteobacteria bacterium]|nr:sigma-70 family RNA polymerase sigma factor [Pseudomonadota bacterium]
MNASADESQQTKKKSFVRVSPSKKAPAKGKAESGRQKAVEPEVLEAEIVDDDSGGPHEVETLDADAVRGEWVDAEQTGGAIAPFGHSSADDESDEYDSQELSESTGIVASSALSRYMAELRRYPLLTLEEERRLAVEAYEKNSVEARQRLVTANLRLVVKIAMDYRRAYAQMLDLIQEGNAGLVQAVNRFNPYRGVKLSTYSAWWIRAYILKFLMDNKSLVRIGTTDAQRKLFFRLRAEAEKMYALTQRFDARLLAEKIGVKESDVVEMNQRLAKGDVSLDAPVFDDSQGARQVDLMEDPRESADEKVAREQILEILREEAAAIERELNERDLFIFRNRILADDPITLQDVGDKFGITRERARQLESRVLKKIRERLEEAGIDVP